MKLIHCLLFVVLTVVAGLVGDVVAQETRQTQKVTETKEFRVVDKDDKTVNEFTILPSDNDSLWRTIRKDISKNISVLIALLSVALAVCSTYMHYRTRKLVKPSERPVINLQSCLCTYMPYSEAKGGGGEIRVKSMFKNIGKHPAGRMRVLLCVVPKEAPGKLKVYIDDPIANTIYPEGELIWEQEAEFPVEAIRQSGDTAFFIYIRVNYQDGFTSDEHIGKFYHICVTSQGVQVAASYATVEQKKEYEKYVKKANQMKL